MQSDARHYITKIKAILVCNVSAPMVYIKYQPAPKYHTKGCSRSFADSPGARTLVFAAFGPFHSCEFRASIARTPFCAILWRSPKIYTLSVLVLERRHVLLWHWDQQARPTTTRQQNAWAKPPKKGRQKSLLDGKNPGQLRCADKPILWVPIRRGGSEDLHRKAGKLTQDRTSADVDRRCFGAYGPIFCCQSTLMQEVSGKKGPGKDNT